MIPKIIWQTHNYLYEDLPSHMKKITLNWKNVNPDWDHRYVNHIERENFVKNQDSTIYELYKKSKPMAQSDIWRMFVLYEYGGVYADMDSVCIKPIDYMLQKYNNQDFISEIRYDKDFVNIALCASIKKSKRLKDIINSVKNDPVEDIDWHTWYKFNKHIKEENIAFFDAGLHAKELKNNFYEFNIDYYGETVTYKHYLKNILKLSDDEYFASIAG